MNYSSLPDIVALSLLLLAFRPIFRRSGVHIQFWFAGWAFILANEVYRFFDKSYGSTPDHPWNAFGSLLITCAGLAFFTAAGNQQHWNIGNRMIAALAAGPVAQSLLFLLNPGLAALLLPATALFYFFPLALAFLAAQKPPTSVVVLGTGFALFGIFAAVEHKHANPLRAGTMLLIFCSAAYFLLRYAPRPDGARVLTAFGLFAWGCKFPLVQELRSLYPELVLHRSLLHLPEYLALGGSMLFLLQERLNSAERLATHDPLTNLPNRRFLQDRFEHALEEARHSKTTIACLVIDVDNFKTINDTHGHGAGDAILQALAVRLGWHIGARDVLARTGGDEFTAMLAGVSNEHYLRFVAEAMMSAASVPVQVKGKPVEVRISMGIALSPDDADEIEDLIRLADEAMYRAKRHGGNVLAFAGDVNEAERSAYASTSAHILQMAAPHTRIDAATAGRVAASLSNWYADR